MKIWSDGSDAYLLYKEIESTMIAARLAGWDRIDVLNNAIWLKNENDNQFIGIYIVMGPKEVDRYELRLNNSEDGLIFYTIDGLEKKIIDLL